MQYTFKLRVLLGFQRADERMAFTVKRKVNGGRSQ